MAATAFFDAAERFLVADRKLARDEAVHDLRSGGEQRRRSVEVDRCGACRRQNLVPELYKICRGAYPQVCSDTTALTN